MEAKAFVEALYAAAENANVGEFQIYYGYNAESGLSLFEGKIEKAENSETQTLSFKVKKNGKIGQYVLRAPFEEKDIPEIISNAVENAELISDEDENFFHDGSGEYRQGLKPYRPLTDKLEKLDKEEQFAAALLSWWVDAQLTLEDFYYYQEPLGPALGTQAQLPILLAEYSFRNREDIDTYLKLLAELPDYFMQIARFEEEKSSAGLFMTDETLDQILNQCRSIMEIDNEHFLVTTFAERLEACSFLDADQKISYEVQNLNALNQYFRPAYQQLCLALEKLRGTGVNTGGLYYTPDGISYYEYLLRYSIGTDLSVPVIRRMLEEQIADDYETILFAIHEGADVLNLTRSVPSASSADEILEDLTVRIQDDFPEIPEDISWQVKEVPESLEDWLSPAFYMVPALDRGLAQSRFLHGPRAGSAGRKQYLHQSVL